MKRTLHGRRHLRARASVQAGREKRFLRKLNRSLKVIERIDWYGIADRMANAFKLMTEAVSAMVPFLQKEILRINKSFEAVKQPTQTQEVSDGLS